MPFRRLTMMMFTLMLPILFRCYIRTTPRDAAHVTLAPVRHIYALRLRHAAYGLPEERLLPRHSADRRRRAIEAQHIASAAFRITSRRHDTMLLLRARLFAYHTRYTPLAASPLSEFYC